MKLITIVVGCVGCLFSVACIYILFRAPLILFYTHVVFIWHIIHFFLFHFQRNSVSPADREKYRPRSPLELEGENKRIKNEKLTHVSFINFILFSFYSVTFIFIFIFLFFFLVLCPKLLNSGGNLLPYFLLIVRFFLLLPYSFFLYIYLFYCEDNFN